LGIVPSQLLDDLENDLGFTPAIVASALNANERTVARWRKDGNYPQHESRRRLASLQALHAHLLETFKSQEIARHWLSSSNAFFGGLAPLDVIRAGRVDRVSAALEAIDSGIFA
jgi:hypothetical protein